MYDGNAAMIAFYQIITDFLNRENKREKEGKNSRQSCQFINLKRRFVLKKPQEFTGLQFFSNLN